MRGVEHTEVATRGLVTGGTSRMVSREALEAYGRFSTACRVRVDRAVADWLDGEARGPASSEVARVQEALRSLATRGGKRLRAVLLAIGYEGTSGAATEGTSAQIAGAAVALELLQVYLLAHDDWMDGDEVRRGGPTVHRMLGDAFGSAQLGDATAVLAGDLAAAFAQSALLSVPAPTANVLGAASRFAQMQRDVVQGQIEDVCASLHDVGEVTLEAVERMHAKKTGSYTVAGPLAIGALLAGTTPARVAALDAFAHPLGVAFQLTDDVLGTFGDPSRTGKPRFGDLRQGKRTALVAEIVKDPSGRALAREILGRSDADDAACQRLADAMLESGAKGRVESRVGELLTLARARLAAVDFPPAYSRLLEGASVALAERTS